MLTLVTLTLTPYTLTLWLLTWTLTEGRGPRWQLRKNRCPGRANIQLSTVAVVWDKPRWLARRTLAIAALDVNNAKNIALNIDESLCRHTDEICIVHWIQGIANESIFEVEYRIRLSTVMNRLLEYPLIAEVIYYKRSDLYCTSS